MKIRKPEMFSLAEEGGKPKLGAIILMFVAVFLMATIAGTIPTLVLMFKDMGVAISQGASLEEAEILINQMTEERSYLYANLFGTILSSIVVILWARFYEKRTMKSLGFRRKNALRDYFVGMLVGFVMFSAVVGINLLTGAMTIENLASSLSGATIVFIFVFLIGFLFQGAFEEILVRGYLMVNVGAKHKVITAIAVSSIAFALLHGINPGISVLAVINLVLVAVFWGLYVICFDNLWGACAMHSIWNFVQGNFYGIKVSGMNIADSVFVTTSVPGKELINGGAFGAEGGIATTIVITLAILILLRYMKKKGKIEKETINESSK